MNRSFRVWAALVVVIGLVFSLLLSCSDEQPENRDADRETAETSEGEGREARAEATETRAADEGTTVARQPDPEAPLVPVAHLSALRESVGLGELSGAQDLRRLPRPRVRGTRRRIINQKMYRYG